MFIPATSASWSRVAAALLFLCASFSATASAVLLLYRLRGPIPGIDLPVAALALRLALFAPLAVLSALLLWRTRTTDQTPSSRTTAPMRPPREIAIALAVAAIPVAALMLPRLDVYPWAAPDEIHHLNVAKNLAQYGRYASGSPEAGFRDFDPYDSVGPTVIVPIAAMFHFFGVSLMHARSVMAAYFFLLGFAVFVFLRGGRSPAAAASGVVLSACAFSSIYLGRTLYGEVPAFAFLLLGITAWRNALDVPRALGWSMLTGIFIGLAILTKTIFILSAFAFATAWLLDLSGPRRIRLVHIAAPSAAVLGLLAIWVLIQHFAGSASGSGTGNLLGLYAQYLLFGLTPLSRNIPYFIDYPLAHGVIFFFLLSALRRHIRSTHDAASTTLYLFAAFVLYWWTFFTPGQLPRYLWPAYVIAAIAMGPSLALLAKHLAWPRPSERRSATLFLLAAMLAPTLLWLSQQTHEVYMNTEMQDDMAVAVQVRKLPPDFPLATAFDPMRGTLRFLADREVAAWRAEANPPPRAVIALSSALPPGLAERYTKRREVGRYTIFERE